MENLGCNSFRSEYFPHVLLRESSSFHQVLERLPRTGPPNGIAALLIIFDKDSKQFSEFLLLARRGFTFIQAEEFICQAVVFFLRPDDLGKCPL